MHEKGNKIVLVLLGKNTKSETLYPIKAERHLATEVVVSYTCLSEQIFVSAIIDQIVRTVVTAFACFVVCLSQ